MSLPRNGIPENNLAHCLGSTQLNSSLLTLSVIAVLLPAAFHFTITSDTIPDPEEAGDILAVSHGVRSDSG